MLPTQTPEQAVNPACPSVGRHGDRNAYNHHRCRCTPARLAAERYNNQRRDDLRAGRPRTVDATGTHRRIRALMTQQWTAAAIAGHLGSSSAQTVRAVLARPWILASTAARVSDVYTRISDMQGPSPWTAKYAACRGWPPPIAWDDDTIDDPGASPWAVELDDGTVTHRPHLRLRPGRRHGLTGYKDGCGCPTCRGARTAYDRDRRQRTREARRAVAS